MKGYPEYQESGVEWIGEIPVHWVAKKLRYFCSMKSGNGFSHDLQGRTGLEILFFKVADTNENKVEMLYAHNTVSPQDVSDFKFILHKPNSIVFPKVGAALLLNKRNILVQKSCIDNNMMSLYSNQSNHKFLYYAMLNVNFKRHYRLGATVPSINESEVGNIPIAYPTHSEQTQIANFLDRKTGQIDELIRIKERRIELLQEQRTALINQAVTKGLDPNVEMKPSGVEWIGEIPKHWVAKKLRYFCSTKSGNGFSHDLQGKTGLEIPFFKVADTNTPENKVEMLFAQNTVSSQEVLNSKFTVHKPNSVVFPKVGAALLLNKRNILAQKSCIDNNMMSLHSNQSDYKFLYYAMLSVDFKRHYRAGSTVPSINESEVGNIPIAYPMHSEQTQIADFLDRKTQQIDELIIAEQRKIELLKEYRQSLIAEVVTGKIDVRSEV